MADAALDDDPGGLFVPGHFVRVVVKWLQNPEPITTTYSLATPLDFFNRLPPELVGTASGCNYAAATTELLWRGHRIPMSRCNPYASDAYPAGAWRVYAEDGTSCVIDARECEVAPALPLPLVMDADTPHIIEAGRE